MRPIIYIDLESLIGKINGYENNPEKSSTTKIGEHIPYGYTMSRILGFDLISPEKKTELKSRKDVKECYICGKRIQKNAKDINYQKVREHCHYIGRRSG